MAAYQNVDRETVERGGQSACRSRGFGRASGRCRRSGPADGCRAGRSWGRPERTEPGGAVCRGGATRLPRGSARGRRGCRGLCTPGAGRVNRRRISPKCLRAKSPAPRSSRCSGASVSRGSPISASARHGIRLSRTLVIPLPVCTCEYVRPCHGAPATCWLLSVVRRAYAFHVFKMAADGWNPGRDLKRGRAGCQRVNRNGSRKCWRRGSSPADLVAVPGTAP